MGATLATLVSVATLYALWKSGTFGSLGLGTGVTPPPPAQIIAPSPVIAQNLQTDSATTSGVAAGLNLIPVAGPAISAAFKALTSVLLQASAARAKAAINENSAVAKGVPGWDQAIAQIVAAYNAGNLSVAQCQQLLTLALANYWSEVTPQIQSGRNGCNGGASCPASANPSSSVAYATTANSNYCSGNIGAACCVGCSDLALSTANMNWAVAQAAKSGSPTIAFIQTVFASKYGGVNRPSYTVTFIG